MTRKNDLRLMLLIMIIFTACKKDLGNYTYKELNETAISEIEPLYTAYRGQELNISPKLAFTKDISNDTSKYSYQWTVIDRGSKIVVGTTQKLQWKVNLPSLSDNYPAFYSVTEKSTGITWSYPFKLKITSIIADGWLILNDIENTARLDFFNYSAEKGDFQYFSDVLATQAKINIPGSPKLVYFYQRRDNFSKRIARTVFVGTDKQTILINTENNEFASPADLSTIVTSYSPKPYYAEKLIAQGQSYLAYMLDNTGALNFENAGMVTAFGVRVNTESNGRLFKISPYIAEAYGSGISYALMYDIDNKRFMEHKRISGSSSVPVISGGIKLFDPGNMNMDILYMDSTPALSGQTFALLKNKLQKLFLIRIVCNVNVFNPLSFEEITTAPEMVQATQFAIDPVEGYIMYAVGSKIYRFNPFDKSNMLVLDAGNKKISLIKYQKMTFNKTDSRYVEYSRKLIVCTYDDKNPSTTGEMSLYNVPNLNGPITLYKSFTGLGKIVSVTYKE